MLWDTLISQEVFIIENGKQEWRFAVTRARELLNEIFTVDFQHIYVCAITAHRKPSSGDMGIVAPLGQLLRISRLLRNQPIE